MELVNNINNGRLKIIKEMKNLSNGVKKMPKIVLIVTFESKKSLDAII